MDMEEQVLSHKAMKGTKKLSCNRFSSLNLNQAKKQESTRESSKINNRD
jgi:hypothetical protein